MKIKFITGFSCFGGSTVAIIEHCKLLQSAGYDVEFYGDCDWHMSQYHNSKKLNDLIIDQDDFLIYHATEMETRPNCKGCYLYCHEKEVFDLKTKKITGYDAIIFVDKSQIKFHRKEGFIIPNPVTNLVDKSKHQPPGKNIAGVVGTIQQRKQQKESIIKALQNGVSKVLLFGDREENYFKNEIEPLLNDKVEYKGFYNPDKRMEIYNQFDVLYHLSSDESASLVVGECEILKKPVVKSNQVGEYDILQNEEILKKWKFLFADKLACVVTYNRKEFIDKWLRAWNNSYKYGVKLAVLHACDKGVVEEEEKNNIIKHKPDFYIPFENTELKDLEALIGVVNRKFGLPDFEYLFWFTDDLLPMRKSFFKPFVEKIQKDNVGLVSQCYEPKSITGRDAHIRTVAYAITKEVAEKLKFPEVGPLSSRGHYFEHGSAGIFENHILRQVLDMGKNFELCNSEIGEDYVHWTSFLDWMWDCHLLGHWQEYEKIYENQFEEIQKFEDMKTTKELLITIEQCEDLTLMPGKICPIIPTSTAPLESFIWSVFSLLLRSDPNVLEHFIVGINGPDSRTGDTLLQDSKQNFIEELRNMKWKGRDMPVTLIRTWSRIGHAQTIEQCISWAHTEFYVSMHDDVIILDKNWCDQIKDFNKNEKLICKTFGPPIHQKLNGSGDLLGLPHFNSIFTLCKKSRMRAINANWIGYHVPFDFYINNLWDYNDFIEWHKKNNLLSESDCPLKNKKYNILSMDIGCCFIPEIFNHKYQMQQLPDNCIKHFSSLSWASNSQIIVDENHKEVLALEKEIIKEESFWNLYKKYVRPRIEKKSF